MNKRLGKLFNWAIQFRQPILTMPRNSRPVTGQASCWQSTFVYLFNLIALKDLTQFQIQAHHKSKTFSVTSMPVMKPEAISSGSSPILSSSQLFIFHDSADDVLLQTNRENDSSITTLIIKTDMVNSAINRSASLHRRFNLWMFQVILTNIEVIRN